MQVHEPMGDIVYREQQCAGQHAIFKPAEIALIDLYQFAQAMPAFTWLVDSSRKLAT